MGERGENLVLTIISFPSVENYTGEDRNAIFSRHLNASSFGFMFREIGRLPSVVLLFENLRILVRRLIF